MSRYWDEGRLAKDFVMRCLDKNPERRWSAKQLLEHEWFKTMVQDASKDVKEEYLVNTGLELYKFKRTS